MPISGFIWTFSLILYINIPGNVTLLKVIVTDIASVAAILSCEAMRYSDERVLLGYVLHYIPAPHQNVTLHDGRDACGGDG